jgi:fatty-acyl-CoA synthase
VLWEFYGSTETGTVAVLRPDEHLARPGSVGRPPAGVDVRIDGGEIYVRSPAVMSGYIDADAGDDAGVREGYVSVGDLGRFDDDGYLYLIDRKHDTIISGGVNVYPAEVERALGEHPGVDGAVVFGLDDPDWGQIVVAMVAGAATDDELRAHLRERIAAFKIPKRFVRIDAADLPIGSSGKPLRRRARDMIVAKPCQKS